MSHFATLARHMDRTGTPDCGPRERISRLARPVHQTGEEVPANAAGALPYQESEVTTCPA